MEAVFFVTEGALKRAFNLAYGSMRLDCSAPSMQIAT
jgi:hypothetical protein